MGQGPSYIGELINVICLCGHYSSASPHPHLLSPSRLLPHSSPHWKLLEDKNSFSFLHSQGGLWRVYCLGACWASLNIDIWGAWAVRKSEFCESSGNKAPVFLRTNVNNTVTVALQISRCTAATVSSHGQVLHAANVFPCSSICKESACSAGDPGLIPWVGKIP